MKFVKTAAVCVFMCIALCCEAKNVKFALLSDVHYTMSANNVRPLSVKVLNCAVDRLNEEKFDYVMFMGDNIDKSKPEFLKAFLETVSKIKHPVYLVLGNHDSYKYSGMDRETYEKIVSQNSRYQKKFKSNYVFYPTQEIAAIVLDSTSLGMPGSHGYFAENTLKWLDKTLEKNKNKEIIIFQHVPIYEPEKLPSHDILNKYDYKGVIKKYNNIRLIVSGHYHCYALNQDEKGVFHLSVPDLNVAPYEFVKMEISYDKLPFSKVKNFKINTVKVRAL